MEPNRQQYDRSSVAFVIAQQYSSATYISKPFLSQNSPRLKYYYLNFYFFFSLRKSEIAVLPTAWHWDWLYVCTFWEYGPSSSVAGAIFSDTPGSYSTSHQFNPLNPELNPICYLLALLGAHHFLHVRRIRVKLLPFRRLMSYIYGAPILDVSRSHTTTQHSR